MTSIQLPEYSIQIGQIWSVLKNLIGSRNYSRTLILVDENTKVHCLPILLKEAGLENPLVLEIKAGESHKNIQTCTQIWTQMMSADINRKALLLNLGGGVIGDMGGFCASTFKRGIDFIQIPTTLLSQVDASIGGKLGIDFAQVKNSVGLFCNPQAVLISPEFLKTLSPRELRSGFAEILKHSLIADADQWQWQKDITGLNEIDWFEVLPPSLKVKKEIVAIDPFEQNIRKALNFGHTIGHAVESVALESEAPLTHGEAIAIGMVCEAYLSKEICGLSLEDLRAIKTTMLRIFGHQIQDSANFDRFVQLMYNDKKNEAQEINFTLLSTPGKAVINQTAPEKMILESLKYYNETNR